MSRALAFGVLWFASGAAKAADPPGTAPTAAAAIAVHLQVIEASNAPAPRVPPTRAARDLASTLNFKSYRTLSEERRPLALAQSTTVQLSNGAAATLTLLAIDRGKRSVRLRLLIEHGVRRLDTEYTVRDGGTVFVSAGNASKGAVLVLAVGPSIR